MRRNKHNTVSTYALIACLGLALLLGQMFKLHMHITHDDIASSDHVVDVHIESSATHGNKHNSMHGSHHGHGFEDSHTSEHTNDIDISFSSLVKKSMSLNQLVFFFFIISIILIVIQLSRFLRKRNLTIVHPLSYYLLQPPLRAPPIYSV